MRWNDVVYLYCNDCCVEIALFVEEALNIKEDFLCPACEKTRKAPIDLRDYFTSFA